MIKLKKDSLKGKAKLIINNPFIYGILDFKILYYFLFNLFF